MSDIVYTPSRNPLFQVMQGNAPMPGAERCTISSNNYYHCDHFSIDFAASAGKFG